MIRFIVVLTFFGITLCEELSAQVRKYSYQQLTEEQGLSQNFVYGLVQDGRGFLWIGTGSGLCRYDGYEMKVFTSKESLSADFVTTSFRSSSGDLIFGHNQGGITVFDGLQFSPLLPDTLGNKIVSITEDHAQNLWIASQSKGLNYVEKATGNISVVFPLDLQGKIINVIFERNRILWIGTNEGLYSYDPNANKLTPFERDGIPPYVEVTSILPDVTDSTLLWIGTAFQGIYLLKQEGNNPVLLQGRFRLPDLSDEIIHAMAQDANGDLWVGTGQSGLLHLNLSSDLKSIITISRFGKKSGFPFSSVNELIIDRQGQIWVSTMGDGIVKIFKQSFTYFPFANRFGVSEVRSITETPAGYQVATDNGLLQISLNLESDEYDVEILNIMQNEPILSVFTDSQKNTWVGTENKGVFLFPNGSKSPEHISIDQKNDPLKVRLFEEDNMGNIWLSARAAGVYVLNKEGKVLRHLTTANKFIHNDIFAIKADTRGNIWFGTYGAGLAMLNKNGELQLFSKQDTLKARDINDIDEDENGNIWIATEGDGIFKYSGNKFSQIGSAENLVSPFIKGIQYDPSGRIWYSYRKGIGYYDLRSEKKHHFTREDGLLSNEAYSSSIIVDSKFNKWFCNDFGVTLFEDDSISDDRKQLQTHLTAIRIFFKDYPAYLKNEGATSGIIAGKLRPLKLTHDENHITFDFAAIKLNRTGKIYYRHFLEGYDSEWTPPKTSNYLTYTNLNPGEYRLKVQATDDPGAWVDPITEYAFVITPPFWKRTWFYLLQIVSVMTLFGLTYFIGRKTIATKRYVLRLMLFSSFFITLEYVENFVDPLVSNFFDGVPVFRFFLNFVLALLLLPVETIITHWLMDEEIKSKRAASAAAEKIADPEEVYEEDKMQPSKE